MAETSSEVRALASVFRNFLSFTRAFDEHVEFPCFYSVMALILFQVEGYMHHRLTCGEELGRSLSRITIRGDSLPDRGISNAAPSLSLSVDPGRTRRVGSLEEDHGRAGQAVCAAHNRFSVD